MQTIQLILVSTILFYGKVFATYSTMISSPTKIPISSSMNKSNGNYLISNNPTFVRYHKCANHPRFENMNLKSKNASTAKTNSTQTSPKSLTDVNNLADVLMNNTDSLSNADQNTKDIYDNMLLLLVHKIQYWLTSNVDLNSISTYLGFPPEIIHLINAAFTELLYQHRKGQIDITNLTRVFFYSCDIEHMRDYNTEDKSNVMNKFKSFLKQFGFTNNDIKNYKESDIVESLKSYINSISKQVSPSFSVTIPLMKNRMFVDESKNKVVNKLKARFIEEYQTNQAKSYEKETDGNKVTENHVNLIGKLIPDIFGFTYNHIELLTKLRECGLDETREEAGAVQRFSGFLINFMEVFINRYFEFKNEYDQPFLDAIYPLIDFLNPDIAPEKPNVSILNYNSKDEKYNDHMWTFTNNALEKLLAVCGNENIEEWKKNRSLKIDYPSKNLTKDELINLMNSNTEDAYEILGVFVSDFVHGVELYNEYKLNISEWPTFIY